MTPITWRYADYFSLRDAQAQEVLYTAREAGLIANLALHVGVRR